MTVEVRFTVPDEDPGPQDVVSTCGGTTVGTASFEVQASRTTDTTEDDEPTTSTTEGDPPTTNTTDTTIRPPETVEECEAQAQQALGVFAFRPDQEMTVGNSHEVAAVLALSEGELEEVPGTGGPTTVTILEGLHCTVEALLTGPDFDITPPDPRPQSFVGTRSLTWTWQVVPLHAGEDLELVLRLQSTIDDDGGSRPGPEKTVRTIITVTATPPTIWDRIGDVFAHPATVPLLGLIVPGGAIGAWLARRSKKEPPPSDGRA